MPIGAWTQYDSPKLLAQLDEITRLGLVRCSQNLLYRPGDPKFLTSPRQLFDLQLTAD